MKRFIAAILLLASSANASALECEGIHNSDARNYCRAIAKHDKSYCEFIKDHDLRFRCRAEA